VTKSDVHSHITRRMPILIRGTTDQVALAEKMIMDLDKPKPEVVDVVVMEANRSNIRDLAATFLTSGAAGFKLPLRTQHPPVGERLDGCHRRHIEPDQDSGFGEQLVASSTQRVVSSSGQR